MRDFEWFEPKTINEAVSILDKYQGKASIYAGGTDLMVTIKQGVVNPDCLVNIKKISGLNSIEYNSNNGFTIGALTSLEAIEKSALVQEKIGVLADAAHKVAATRIRTVATIAGNLCQDSKCEHYARIHLWRFEPCYRGGGKVCHAIKGAKSCQAMASSDMAPALLCLDAVLVINGPNGERTLPVDKLFVRAGIVNLKDSEVITHIKIPDVAAGSRGVYEKHTLRSNLDFAIAAAGVLVDKDTKSVKIALNGVARTPFRATGAEEILNGKEIDEGLIEQAAVAAVEQSQPWSDLFCSATYRRKSIKAVVTRALKKALDIT